MNANRFYGMMDGLFIAGVVSRVCSGIDCTYICKNGKKIETNDNGYYITVGGIKIPMEDIEDIEIDDGQGDVIITYKTVIRDTA